MVGYNEHCTEEEKAQGRCLLLILFIGMLVWIGGQGNAQRVLALLAGWASRSDMAPWLVTPVLAAVGFLALLGLDKWRKRRDEQG